VYDKAIVHKFAMQAERTAQANPHFAGHVNYEEIGQQIGLSKAESLNVALYLTDLDWASINTPWLTITPKGFEEIGRLRWPRWKSFINRWREYLIVSFFIAVIGGVAAGLLLIWLTPRSDNSAPRPDSSSSSTQSSSSP
jgi:hypothetical protein